ncbi:DNA recombination protein RmuC [Arenimonas sp. MALMAid1274]|uniref:DNA recombination protein RmuC n=1 Tax=Arenimonas sp. MALMAid1274 TaxID=3411630 RepID=UPI003B9EA8F5
MSASELIFLLLGLLVGVIVAAIASVAIARRRLDEARASGRSEMAPELGRATGELQATVAQRDELRARLAAMDAELREIRGSRDAAETRAAGLDARLAEQQAGADQRYRDLEASRERMKAEFQALAAEILEEKSRRFGEQNVSQLGNLLNPLREQLGDFRKVVTDAYEKEGRERTTLQAELKQLFELNRQLSDEAGNLTRALTSDNRTQGYWGELKLERLLETGGLEKGQQYLTQESFKDEAGDRYRPDALLLLPDDRQIVIDAKVALLDYQRACETADDAEREQHMVRHAGALRTHVKQLGEKDYSRLHGLTSPDLVLMFVPVEAAFLEALRRDPELYDFAFTRKIILVGPSNLLASLRLVAQIWRTEQQTNNAKAIAERGAVLYDKFVGFVEDMGRVGESLDRAQKAQQDALQKLSQGKGNLVRQAEMLRKLGVAPSKKMPLSLQDLSDTDEETPAP